MSDYFDVIVVGARVAGASTAMLLAQQGHHVLVMDRAPMPSDTVSTHAMLRTGVLQLSRWGLLDRVIDSGAAPIREITLGFGRERISFEVRSSHGIDTLYAPRRVVLDRILLEAAQSSGAEFFGETRLTGVRRDEDGNICGVAAERSGEVLELDARMVIGADGVWSRVANLVQAPIQRGHRPTNAVHYAYYRDVRQRGFWFQFTPGVNAGIIPTNDDLCCVFVGRPSREVAAFRADPEAEFHRLLRMAGSDLAERVSAGSRVSQFRGTKGLPGQIRKPFGPTWALVGDAGYTKDPISAHGISDALRDAELCARAVDRAIRRPEEAVEAMSEYQQIRDELSSVMFGESEALAAYHWEADEASARMRLISQAVREECDALMSLPERSTTVARV